MELQTAPTRHREWLASFPTFASITDPAWQTLVRCVRTLKLDEEQTLYVEGESCSDAILVVSGSVRVQKSSANGNVITLYHLKAGDVCDLSISSLLSGRSYPAEAVAESDAIIALLPKQPFQDALIESAPFRDFVFSSLGRGVVELVTLLEEVAFGQMEGRLARQLLSYDDKLVECTHQALAEELGSAREVISRLLKRFEHHHCVRLHRGCIEILDRRFLQQIARHIGR